MIEMHKEYADRADKLAYELEKLLLGVLEYEYYTEKQKQRMSKHLEQSVRSVRAAAYHMNNRMRKKKKIL
jgi:uncharacterized short protein YbdD (DUF466 family)